MINMKIVDGEIFFQKGDEVIVKDSPDIAPDLRNMKGIVTSRGYPYKKKPKKRFWRNELNLLYDEVTVFFPILDEKELIWRQHLLPAKKEDKLRAIAEIL